MKNILKKALPDIIAILAFVVISFAYFYPADIDGRVLTGSDNVGGIGAGVESTQYKEQTGHTTRWTNSLFSGMPTYQISPSYGSTDLLNDASTIYKLGLPQYVNLVFIMLVGFYILLRAFDFKPWMAVLGAVIWAFSTYFIIIIGAGHIWKFVTLAYIPPTIAGMILAYKGKYLCGGIVAALFASLQIMSNHVQMTYYFLFVILFMIIAYFIDAYKKHELPRFTKATGVLAMAAIVSVMINSSNLYHTYEYSKDTMRGKSELVKPSTENQTSSGLERDYITQWSYGIGETWSLLIPNIKGGSSSTPLSSNEGAMEKADSNYMQIYQQLPSYWGEQPGTAGPVYVGAFVLMLAILGCFILKGPMKWALLASTILSIVLSWGKNFMGPTNFFIDYFPMYAKFRAVSSILVIAEFTIPLLALLALKKIIEQPNIIKEKQKQFYISLGLTGGVSLLFALMPGVFFSSFISSNEMQALQQGIPSAQLGQVLANLTAVRQSIMTSDAWRSFIIVALGGAFMWLYSRNKLKSSLFIGLVSILCFIDLWSINKRYLKDDDFVDPSQRMAAVQKTPTDEKILQDKSLDYRVLNFATSTFNENNTSYWHKSIGGYHAAKLRRYQEMIEYHISPEMKYVMNAAAKNNGDMTKLIADSMKVINMLNGKYFILPLQGNKTMPINNPYAYGNAWFVQNIKYVNTANEEIETLYKVSPRNVAIVGNKFKETLSGATNIKCDSTDHINLISYTPNDLTYQTNAKSDQIAVFSEIYYPGWQAYIDGKSVDHGRADYILRVMKVPAGNHKIEFKFDPSSIHTTETVAYIGLGILIIGAIGLGVKDIRKKKD